VAAAWRHGVGPLDRDRDREALLRADLAAEIGWLDLAEAVGALGDGDRDRAAALLEAVLESSSHPTLTRHAAAIAARARLAATASPQRDAADAWHLTERELEVLRLAAEGLTNRELAERLFISPKTASVHMSNLMRKLGVSDRRAAVAVARREGIVPDVR
jgi:DNA-binding NarL/FixJ family response regulator